MRKIKQIFIILLLITIVLLPVFALLTIWSNWLLGLKLILSDITILIFLYFTSVYLEKYLNYETDKDE